MNNVSIQGDIRYINFEFDPFTIPVLAAFAPIIYVIPTVFIVIKIIKVYVRCLIRKKQELINPHVFSIIVLSQFLSFCYMLADYSTIRLPSTGIMTSWCASGQPSHFLKVLFMLSVYFNYTSMLFPFLLSILRLIPLYRPFNHEKLSGRIVSISTPLIFLYPFLFCFPLFPALGTCLQLKGDYHFGAIFIFYDRSWFNIKQANTLFLNVIAWFFISTVTNTMLYLKLRKLRNKRRSLKLQRAEFSLSVTTLSMLSAYITNLAFVAAFIFLPGSSAYLVALRPYGNDCDFVSVPWIFYLTHPIFKQQKVLPTEEVRQKWAAVVLMKISS
ncbi:hypothetical protein GCK72_020304 [Caenorhabditis remanei]|uniref:Uncharacterized protein n=1 Tax=Caenorhabditis remanei TaxID=31234 RepID=A0A6A5GET5_CAERE|nr:hypothetical protein GCK72_020304 [Caenorhabditis remanei]KAF1753747.1 hypothetical protein GCK72_020304 [Caenorhabditis remanei]